ncbi:MAG: hypothetical protein M3083_25370 [Actinomycetota bacterium]|nr:hypothetical protein [Actinomycetota bacterium]
MSTDYSISDVDPISDPHPPAAHSAIGVHPPSITTSPTARQNDAESLPPSRRYRSPPGLLRRFPSGESASWHAFGFKPSEPI